MARIGFIGLGVMGRPMALNLVKRGHDVTAFNRSPRDLSDLQEAGARIAQSIAEACRGADIVALMLPDSPQVTEVLRADAGVLAEAELGALVIDFSTISPDVAVDLSSDATAAGLRFVDAPVSGGEAGAIAGTLSIMVGGKLEDFEAADPIFEVVGSTARYVGGPGAGQRVKAANQLMVAIHLAALAEALTMLGSADVDIDAALDVLGGGLAGSAVLRNKANNMLTGEYRPGFRLDLHAKDLRIVRSIADATGIVLPTTSLVTQLVASARANGDGDLDHSALMCALQRLNGSTTTPTTREGH